MKNGREVGSPSAVRNGFSGRGSSAGSIGERAEQAYGDRAREIAAELAVHFEQGREYRKAVQYLLQAWENATQRSAHQEAITLLTKGLALLTRLPDTPARAHQELSLQVALALPLMLTKGLAAPEVGAVHTRALALCRQIGETPQLFPALWGAQIFYLTRAERPTARELAGRLLSLARREQHSAPPGSTLLVGGGLACVGGVGGSPRPF
jgi:predicted ATPase